MSFLAKHFFLGVTQDLYKAQTTQKKPPMIRGSVTAAVASGSMGLQRSGQRSFTSIKLLGAFFYFFQAEYSSEFRLVVLRRFFMLTYVLF